MINRIIFQFYYGVFQFLSKCFPPTSKPIGKNLKNILVFSAAGIGDTLTDSVAIRALKETFPSAQITVVTHRRREVLACHNPFADQIIPYHKSFFRFVSLALQLHALRPDAVVMLRGNDPDLWPLAFIANRHAIVSCPVMTRFKFLISHPVILPNWDTTHGVEQTLDIVRTLGADSADRRLVYQVKPDEKESLIHKISSWKSSRLPMTVFQVGGGRRSSWRDWPVEYFAELGSLLLRHYQTQLILLGGPDLKTKAETLIPLLPKQVVNLVGRLKISESAALLSEAKILVSTDTGIMHLGFAVGTDTLALIHCNNPASRVGPYGYGDKNPVAQLEPPPGIPVSKNVDMKLLTPEYVWPKLQALCERNRYEPLQPMVSQQT